MPSCEKCWSDAYHISRSTGNCQAEAYAKLLKEREDSPCTPKQQAGQFWDEEKQIDKRKLQD
jgi:hypothetical protein